MEKRIYSDVSIPAYLQTIQKPFTITPELGTDGIVRFIVEGNGIDDALKELFANASVPALDYIKNLKSLRSSIFVLKGGVRDGNAKR